MGLLGFLRGLRRRACDRTAVDAATAEALAAVGDGYLTTDRDGHVTGLNAVAARVTGWTAEEALGRSVWQVFDREDRPPGHLARSPVDVMLAQGVTARDAHAVVVVARDGRRTPLVVHASLMRDADGTPCGLAMVFRDRSAELAAGATAQRLAAIVESSQDAIIGKTLDGRITSWNAAAQALFGYSAEEAIGRSVLMLIPPDRADEEMRIVADLQRGRRVPAFHTRRRARDGTLRDVSVSISPILDADGRVVGAAKIARDVSAQRHAEEARLLAERLVAENRRVQDASRMKSRFLASMSHELRTPLNAVIGFADLLRGGTATDPAVQARYAGHIATSGRHLLQLINDVLDLTKIEAGRFDFHPEAVALPVLVDEVIDALHGDLTRKRLQMAVEVAPGLEDLWLDPVRLRQVLYNYLSNAIKFTADGGRITLHARPEGDTQLRIEVADTGIGIAEADLGRLFVEFQQLDEGHARHHGGTGLGLALTRRLVQAQGGSVGVQSVPGIGSTFHLVLPMRHRVDDTAAAAPLDPRHVLVIEHDAASRDGLVQGLATEGLHADPAASAAQAQLLAAARGYDGITLELLLPGQRGLGLLASLRRYGPSRDAPVLGMAVATGGGPAALFPVADVLSKPIDTAQVLAALQRAGLLEPTGQRVLVVDDDAQALALMQATLAAAGLDARGVDDSARALTLLDDLQPAALVLDLMMPGMDGFAVLDALRSNPAWRDLPVFVWTSLLLDEIDYQRLAGSARAILGKGGGTLVDLLDRLRRTRRMAPVADLSGITGAP